MAIIPPTKSWFNLPSPSTSLVPIPQGNVRDNISSWFNKDPPKIQLEWRYVLMIMQCSIQLLSKWSSPCPHAAWHGQHSAMCWHMASNSYGTKCKAIISSSKSPTTNAMPLPLPSINVLSVTIQWIGNVFHGYTNSSDAGCPVIRFKSWHLRVFHHLHGHSISPSQFLAGPKTTADIYRHYLRLHYFFDGYNWNM